MKKKRRMTLAGKRAIAGLLFISPWLVGFLAFYVRSLIQTLQFALSDVGIDPENGGYTLTFVGKIIVIVFFADPDHRVCI